MSIEHGLAGDKNEGRRVEKLREILEDVSDEVKVYRERILTWEVNHSLVIINGERIEHQVLPYSPTSYIRGHIVENPRECGKGTVLVNGDESQSSVYYNLVLAKRFGCQGVLLTKIRTVSVSPPYLQDGASEPPLPLILLRNANPKRGNLVEINLEAKARIGHAYSIHAIKNGKEQSKKILLVSNHDTWLSGSNAWMTSAKIFRELKNNPDQWEYLCMSGIESGAPGFSSLYWGYVARQLGKRFIDRHLAVELSDTLGLSLSPGMKHPSMEGKLISPASISFELLRAGIPSANLGIRQVFPSSQPVDLIKMISALSSSFQFSLEKLINDLVGDYSLLSAEIKALLTNLRGEAKEAKYLLRYLGRYMGLPGEMEYALFHKIVAIRKSPRYEFMFVEGNPALTIERANNEFLRGYRSELDKEVTDAYLSQLYEDLQELL
ncbi:hypothetical protein L3N51_00046 [Metallosphaera sp. J1]|uniref:hypothetical protein n=1 Tax=Metallosphaera javensis (ex Hofmann et al. 2022) TaxID=99938 RepID=UPI001EE01D42|nr:hypothetical protein [Metallosphaera javensis (ex Hofmann et al. 2022)]MCG3107781.1 hypothetical protein [Metallosphaera javensis (ex Hofmann et al. 2022)]